MKTKKYLLKPVYSQINFALKYERFCLGYGTRSGTSVLSLGGED